MQLAQKNIATQIDLVQPNTAVRRMAWRCRRGMLELDLLFVDFVKNHLSQLTDKQISALDKLLDLPDNQLWELATSPSQGLDIETNQVLNLLSGNAK